MEQEETETDRDEVREEMRNAFPGRERKKRAGSTTCYNRRRRRRRRAEKRQRRYIYICIYIYVCSTLSRALVTREEAESRPAVIMFQPSGAIDRIEPRVNYDSKSTSGASPETAASHREKTPRLATRACNRARWILKDLLLNVERGIGARRETRFRSESIASLIDHARLIIPGYRRYRLCH